MWVTPEPHEIAWASFPPLAQLLCSSQETGWYNSVVSTYQLSAQLCPVAFYTSGFLFLLFIVPGLDFSPGFILQTDPWLDTRLIQAIVASQTLLKCEGQLARSGYLMWFLCSPLITRQNCVKLHNRSIRLTFHYRSHLCFWDRQGFVGIWRKTHFHQIVSHTFLLIPCFLHLFAVAMGCNRNN